MSKLNIKIDEDEEFVVTLRKKTVSNAVCSKGSYFRNKITGEKFSSPMILKGYIYDAEGNPLDNPEIDSLENYEVLPYDK